MSWDENISYAILMITAALLRYKATRQGKIFHFFHRFGLKLLQVDANNPYKTSDKSFEAAYHSHTIHDTSTAVMQ